MEVSPRFLLRDEGDTWSCLNGSQLSSGISHKAIVASIVSALVSFGVFVSAGGIWKEAPLADEEDPSDEASARHSVFAVFKEEGSFSFLRREKKDCRGALMLG